MNRTDRLQPGGAVPDRPRVARPGVRFAFLALVIVLVALWFVPTGLLVVSPGQAAALVGSVEIGAAGAPTAADPGAGALPEGDVLLLTAQARPANPYLALAALLGYPRGAAVVAKRSMVPPGMTDEQFVAYNHLLMAESVGLASAVAVREAGGTVAASAAGVRVVAVPAGAGETWFRPGDLIVALNGQELEFSGDVARALSGLEAGTEVQAVVRRDGDECAAAVLLKPSLRGAGELKLGLLLATEEPRVETVPAVAVNTGSIGGPSGGLALAIAIYARLGPEDLLGGRLVAASGQIRLDGSIGPVGGVGQKALAAQSAGADVFLVHPANAAEVRARTPALSVIEVQTFAGALAYLRGTR